MLVVHSLAGNVFGHGDGGDVLSAPVGDQRPGDGLTVTTVSPFSSLNRHAIGPICRVCVPKVNYEQSLK